MDVEELTKLYAALGAHTLSLAGRLAALEAANGAIMAAVGMAHPTLLPQIIRNIEGLAPLTKGDLQPECHAAFDAAIGDFCRNVRALSQ